MPKRGPPRESFIPPLKRPTGDCPVEESCVGDFEKRRSGESNFSSEQENVDDLELRVRHLREKDTKLDEEILELREQGFEESQLQIFIEKLHKYNAIKDLGQALLGQLAIRQGTTTKSLYPNFNLELDN